MLRFNRDLLRRDLTRDESNELFVYDDKNGKRVVPGYTMLGHPTIGRGRALDIRGISQAVSDAMLDEDIDHFSGDMNAAFVWFGDLDEVRQRALINMALNIGVEGVRGFKNMILYLSVKKYALAAYEARNSFWAKNQVGARAERIAYMIEHGVDQPIPGASH